ncbi:hypothetical protein [Yersinia pekkanenii]|uniref:Uncharacterized protein n=1 Tax=Yersinia pekkanenii TaxID=1288385 RepID=A0A0T9NWY9_9GAMM|nr:hypothetical protein [Yersinia pekkanenii]CNH34389.1 Uncharacterised protein [Yersinia pekkanenii]CRY69849.1 Uncharacterised protein [Yersinia pekkanenii]
MLSKPGFEWKNAVVSVEEQAEILGLSIERVNELGLELEKPVAERRGNSVEGNADAE